MRLVFTGEEVLYRRNRSFAASEPIFQGIAIYRALTASGPAHVLCNTNDLEKAEMLVKLNGMPNAMCIVHNEKDGLEEAEWYWQMVKHLQSQGPITAVVTAHVDLVERCTHGGIHTLLFVRPGSPVADAPSRQPWGERVLALQERILREAEEEMSRDEA